MFDLVAFYATVSGLSFTLLGLWWVVAERRRTWFDNAHHRRMAYVVSLHFMLPGAMSVLSLADSTGTFFWHLVFVLAGIAGMVGALMVRQLGGGRSGCARVRRSGGCGWDARDQCRGAGKPHRDAAQRASRVSSPDHLSS